MEPSFPTFDRFSMPLILLLAQGFLFVILISIRFLKKRNISDLLLGALLFFFCYERIHYTVGFMAWYDSFPNTKINYFLFAMTLVYGPLLYFYVKSITTARFRFKKVHILHFLPFILYLLYRGVLLMADSSQLGFSETQNGYYMSHLEITIVSPLHIILSSFHMLLYLAFTIQLYWYYRMKIKEFYSNTYKLELNWIRNFLVLFGLLFLYDVFQNIIDGFIMNMHWQQKWWFHALSCVAIIYFGIKGFFTKTDKLQSLEFSYMPIPDAQEPTPQQTQEYAKEKAHITKVMEEQKPYLDPSLTLHELAKLTQYSTSELSSIINAAFQVNFNDFVNAYRVQEVKSALLHGKQEELSLVGIAYDSGFNSKATFNRVFKKLAGVSPSEFIKNQVK